MTFKKKSIIVTDGGSEIGAEIARQLAAAGCKVTIAALNESEGNKACP